MAQPKAYQPKEGFQFQILFRTAGDIQFEHCGYAEDEAERDELIQQESEGYGDALEFKAIKLPKKYWKNSAA